MPHDLFSTAQMFGHAALLVSFVTFSRKHDSHFKIWLTGQNLLYATHLFLMGNPAGMVAQSLSATRNIISLRTRSMRIAMVLLAANFLLGFWVMKAAWNVIPLIAVAVATVSMFRFQGKQLRYGMFCATLLWLINNILTGSISATLMETMIAIISCNTIYRLHVEEKERAVSQRSPNSPHPGD